MRPLSTTSDIRHRQPLRVPPFKQHSTRAASSLYSHDSNGSISTSESSSESSSSSSSSWNGQVASNSKDGRIRGCVIQPAHNGVANASDSLDQILSKNTEKDVANTEWIVQIDGVEADLGRFSLAIYKKFLNDAKQQQYQGYRRGTIPPPLLVTYKAYAMDECARETILEAMEQNQIRPFETCRSEMILYDFSIPPQSKASNSKNTNKKSKGKKKSSKTKSEISVVEEATIPTSSDAISDEHGDLDALASTDTTNGNINSSTDMWTTYATMKEAIDIGLWQPGQSFSFCAKSVRGQSVKVGTPYGTAPLGVNY